MPKPTESNRPSSMGNYTVDCAAIRELLFGYASHELGDAQSQLVREHLRHCSDCAREAAELQRVVELMKQNDPAKCVGNELSPKRRARTLWLMAHPCVAKCIHHRKITGVVIAIIVMTSIFFYLLTLKYPEWFVKDLPRIEVHVELKQEDEKPLTELEEAPPPVNYAVPWVETSD